jgi:hypothetical protein
VLSAALLAPLEYCADILLRPLSAVLAPVLLQLACGGERQEAVLAAARQRRQAHERTGGGAMLLSIAGSSHNTFAGEMGDPLNAS